MPYSESLAERIRNVLGDRSDVSEKKMFGGLAFMVAEYMCVGVSNDQLMARVGPENYEEALARPGASVMDFTGRPMKGYVFVGPEGIRDDADLRAWVALCEEFIRSLPPR